MPPFYVRCGAGRASCTTLSISRNRLRWLLVILFCGNDFFRYTKTKPLRSYPPKRWTTTVVQGIRRHTFRFRDSDATNLADWRNGRPRVQKDFLLRRINVPNESGLVVDCGDAWNVLSEIAAELAAGHTERSITASNLILGGCFVTFPSGICDSQPPSVVYFKQQSGSATFRLNKAVNPQEWREIWVREGFDALPDAIHFYESPPGGLNGVWGYFSFSPVPGTPHRKWTPESDDDGETWGWTFQSDDWTVELSKPNIKQYIRYVQL
ncbi:hypothetical protein B0H10DRAFT_568334 [Mycena sp. CBHHK59/15]|nr:hypothetical protein B0H10DRAFT_568334 [Mycena sp. CBHHK59/15]